MLGFVGGGRSEIMASQEMGLVPAQRFENGKTSSQLVFPEEPIRFSCASPAAAVAPRSFAGGPSPRTRELSGFINEKQFSGDRNRYFAAAQGGDFRRSVFAEAVADGRNHPESQNWRNSTPSGEGSDDDDNTEDEDEDDEVEVDEEDGDVDALRLLNNDNRDKNAKASSSDSIHSCATLKRSIGGPKRHSIFGSDRVILAKENNFIQSAYNNITRAAPIEDRQQERLRDCQNAVTIVEPGGDMFYSKFLEGPEGSGLGQKDCDAENGCSFSGRKDVADSSEPGESLRAILSDPITGFLMDDAMILPCGHSFSSNGFLQVLRMKACFTCSQPISESSVSPNLSLRAAVQAFRREEESRFCRTPKRRRERTEQDKGHYNDSYMEAPRGRGVQFPFAVTDRVIIKGNKRTPERFVGREAVVTMQCLNGWYVVKTLDNAESVKLQYRSLAKVSDNLASKATSSKMPNWL